MQRPGVQGARHTNATAAAQSYAPKPNGSVATYGAIGASSILVVALVAGGYFGIDVTSNGWGLGALAALAFIGGAVLRIWRQNEHSRAVAQEYAMRSPQAALDERTSSDAEVKATAVDQGEALPGAQEIVTFTLPFTLPGLGRPHPPGSFLVWERREPLDVSWDAFVVTKTIMLTGSGSVEALDVKADDLAAALDRDREATAEGPQGTN
jgi:hypothetical protein